MTRSTEKRKGFTLVELLVVIALISIIAGLVLPGIGRGIREAHKLQCTNNLRGIYLAAFEYAQKDGFFPVASGPGPRAHDSLNVLLESRFGTDLEAEDLICAEGEFVPAAEIGPLGSRLAEHCLGYTWPTKRLKPTKKAFLSSCKYYEGFGDAEGTHSGHDGMVVAIDTSGKVHYVDVSELSEDGLLPDLGR